MLWRFAGAGTAMPPRIVVAAVPLYLALWLAIVALHAWRWQMVLSRLGTELPLPRLVRLWLAARAVGSLVPSGTLGGEPVRVQLLTAHGVPAPRAAGAVALDRSIELAGLALLVAIYVRGMQRRPALVPIFAPPLLLVPRRWRAWIREHLARADAAMREMLAEHPGLVPAGLGISLAIEALHLVELTALYAVFALAVPLPLLLLSSIGIGIAHAVPVTAALGTLEATQVGLFTVGGAPLATGLVVAVALRIAETVSILTGLVCLATAPGWRGNV